MNFVGFLCLDGQEITNQTRVMRYVANGIPGAAINISLSHTCTSEHDSSCLACYTEALDEDFQNPAVDDAPWFTSFVPASEEFLGFMATDITVNSPFARSVSSRNGLGGYIGPLGIKERSIQVEGLMFATTPRGMSYGERWLYDVLQGSCGNPTGGELTVLPHAPPEAADEDEMDATFRTMLEVGIIDGPEFTSVIDQNCSMQKASFTLVAGQPFLYAPPTTIINGIEIGGSNPDDYCGTYTTDDWVGDATTRIEIQNISGYNMTNTDARGRERVIEVKMYASHGTISADFQNPCMELSITHLKNEETLVIDSRYRQILVYDVSKKRYVNGMDHVSFDGLFKWGDIGPCTEAVICVRNLTAFDTEIRAFGYGRTL